MSWHCLGKKKKRKNPKQIKTKQKKPQPKLKEGNKQKAQIIQTKRANRQSSRNKNKQAKSTPDKIMVLPKKEEKTQLQGKKYDTK